MAGVKYIKKTPKEQETTTEMAPKKSAGAPTRVSSRQAAIEETKPEANTKVKVTKPVTKAAATTKAAAKAPAKATAKAPAKGRGRPKATETATKARDKTTAAAKGTSSPQCFHCALSGAIGPY